MEEKIIGNGTIYPWFCNKVTINNLGVNASRTFMAEKGTIQCRSQNLARLVLQLSFQVNISRNSQLSFKCNYFLVSELVKATIRNMVMLMQNLIRYMLTEK